MDKGSKKRQEQYNEIKSNQYYIEGQLDFNDCEDNNEVIDAACKLLEDNFDIAHNGTYIYEIIQNACWETAQRGVEG